MAELPEGWYPDQSTPNVERFWDGSQWTGQTRPATGTESQVNAAPQEPTKVPSPSPAFTPPAPPAPSGFSQVAMSPKTPGIVIAAFVLSLLGLCGITAVIGIILGIIGMRSAKKVNKGSGLAIAAIVIGALWLLVLVSGQLIGHFGSNTSASTTSAPSQSFPPVAPTSAAATPSFSNTPSPTPSAYQSLLTDGKVTSPAICGAYSKLVSNTDKAVTAELKSGQAAVGDPYKAKALIDKVDWLNGTASEDFSKELNDLATKSFAQVTNGRGGTPDEVTLAQYLDLSISECKLTDKVASLTTKVNDIDSLSRQLSSNADSLPWYPKGYNEYQPGLAFKWVDGAGNDCYSCRYLTMDVISQDGCPNELYVEVNFLDRSGAVIDYSNDVAQSLNPGQRARLQFESYSSNARSSQINKIDCY